MHPLCGPTGSGLGESGLTGAESPDIERGQSLALARMLAVTPCFAGCGRAGDLLTLPALPARTLLHAGPPLSGRRAASPTLLAAVVAAARRDGFAATDGEARAMLAAGDIKLRPAQDFNVVTTLDTVVGPSSTLACVVDRKDAERRAFAVATEADVPYESGVQLPFGGALLESNPGSAASRLAAAARKCVLQAVENIAGCTIVTALGANGTAVGLQMSGLGRLWLSTDDLWLKLLYPQLRRVDRGILAGGDLLLRCALVRRGEGAFWLLDAKDRLSGAETPAVELARQIPSGLFTTGLSNIRSMHWSFFIPAH